MALDRLVNTLQFSAIAAGDTVSRPHGLRNAQGPLEPDFLLPNAGGFSIDYDEINVTVTNTGESPASIGVMPFAIHTIARELGGDTELSIQPFIVAGGGSGTAGAADNRINAITDGHMSAGGVTDDYAAYLTWLSLGATQQMYIPGGAYAVTIPGPAPGSLLAVAASTTRHIVGDGDSSVYNVTLTAPQSVVVSVAGTLVSESQRINGLTSGVFASGSISYYGVPGSSITTRWNTFEGQSYIKMAGDAGPSGDYRLRDWGSYFHVTGDLTYGTPNGLLAITAITPDRRGSVHLVGSRFNVFAPDTGSGQTYAHCTYISPGCDLLCLGVEFERSGSNDTGGGYGLHYNAPDIFSTPVAEYSLAVGCVFGPGVAHQLYPNSTCHTMAIGCGFTLGDTDGGCISIRARSEVATTVIGCSMGGVGTANVDDANETIGSAITLMGCFFSGHMAIANLQRQSDDARNLWRVIGSDFSNTNDESTCYGLIQRSGETEIAFSSFKRSGEFGTDSQHTRIAAGLLVLTSVRVENTRSVWLTAEVADTTLRSNETLYRSADTGDGLFLQPLAAHTITVQGYGNRFEGSTKGPTIDLTESGGLGHVTGTLRAPGGDESFTIGSLVANAATVSCNTDFVRLKGPSNLQRLILLGSDTNDANGPTRVFNGFRLKCWVDTTGFTVVAGGNIAASSLAIGAHAAGTTFELTLVDRVWY